MIKLLKEYVQPLSLLLPPPPAQYAPRYPEAEQICERVTSENKVINHTYAGVRVYMKFAGINVIDNDIIDRTRFTGEECCCYCFNLFVDYAKANGNVQQEHFHVRLKCAALNTNALIT